MTHIATLYSGLSSFVTASSTTADVDRIKDWYSQFRFHRMNRYLLDKYMHLQK